MKSNIEHQYLNLLNRVLTTGHKKGDRTGAGTIAISGAYLEHDMSLGFPLLSTKEVHFRSVITELVWFLKGRSDLRFLLDRYCNIWNGDALRNYQHITDNNNMSMKEFIERIKTDEKFNKNFGNFGPIYGPKWRNFHGVDQVDRVMHLLKTDPDSRRMIVLAYDPSEENNVVLPPCHYSWQVTTRELEEHERTSTSTRAISLHYNMRSNDLFLGAPFNIASYALLLELLANEFEMVPEKLSCSITDAHIYQNHVEQVREQLNREPHSDFPKIHIGIKAMRALMEKNNNTEFQFIHLVGYDPAPAIKAPLNC